MFSKVTESVTHVSIHEHRLLKPLDITEAEKDTAKAQRDVMAEQRDSEEVKNKVIKEAVEIKEKHHTPETPGEKSALAQEILKEEHKLLEDADNEVENAAESLTPLETSIKNDEVSAEEATKKLGETEAALEESQAIASASSSMEKKLPIDTASIKASGS